MAATKKYSDDSDWADITPLPQDEGSENPLAAIAYADDYSVAMSYLRAVMANNEMSERVLDLTKDIIQINPAHYTVWLYRAKVLFALNKNLETEIQWVNATALKHLKNYQIWHHRQTLVDKRDSPVGEIEFIEQMLGKDSKNYHVWSYRLWLVRRFDLFNEAELAATESFIQSDIRNNSAWNHRWFVVSGRGDHSSNDEQIWQREIEYCKSIIRRAPQNQSPWNYMRGLSRRLNLPAASQVPFANEFVSKDMPKTVTSSHALEVLAEAFGEDPRSVNQAIEILDLLASKYDPIRANYWRHRKRALGGRT